MKENPFNKVVKTAKRVVLAAGLAVSPMASVGQTDTVRIESLSSRETAPTERENHWAEESYQTQDGNLRYYHNPTGTAKEGRTFYSLGSTMSPFKNTEEMKLKTRVPESLGETDFFTNYINAKRETEKVITDSATGNRYHDFIEYDPGRDSVSYEGDAHWNIQRFLIDPHYSFFGVKKEEARNNALYDLYKYFLYQEKGDREKAWEEANNFLKENVDPIVESKYAKWANENKFILGLSAYPSDSAYYDSTPNLYSSDDRTTLPDQILQYNSAVLSGAVSGKLYRRDEIVEVLTDYNINYRKKSPEEAKTIAERSVSEAEDKYREREEELRNRPVTPYKVIKNAEYPPDFDNWSPEEQDYWRWQNPDKLGEVQEAFTEEDRERQLKDLATYKFAD